MILFYREIGNGKLEVKISEFSPQEYVKEILNKIQ